MSKAVLLSVQPKWCEMIASGRKTVELRKTKPKIDVPFRVYIYCTNAKPLLGRCLRDNSLKVTLEYDFDIYNKDTLFRANGKVIGEFVCDEITELAPLNRAGDDLEDKACMSREEIVRYLKGEGYAWHISDLVIYDKPKELREFHAPCDGKCNAICYVGCPRAVARPPQSWCYVEELR